MAEQFSSIVLELAAPGVRLSSYHALAWVLKQTARKDAALAATLHAPNAARPLSVWVGTYDELGGAFEPLHPDANALIRITGAAERVTAALLGLAARPPAVAALDSLFLPIVGAWADATQHPLCGRSHLADLVRCATASDRDRRVTLHFLTPTAFGGRPKTLFPLPDRVFGSLITNWNTHTPAAVPEGVAAQLLDSVQVESHHLATAVAPGPAGGFEKGFRGWCEYSVPRAAPLEVVRAMHLLARAAFYLGVGGRTTMGMGQVLCEAGTPQGVSAQEHHPAAALA